jgi:hypothetical protein
LHDVFAEDLDEGLHSPSPMHVHRYVNKARLDYVSDQFELLEVGDFKYLLTEVVPKLVHHQVSEEGGDGLHQGSLEVAVDALGLIVVLQALLKHPATLLVIAEEVHLPDDLLVLLGQYLERREDKWSNCGRDRNRSLGRTTQKGWRAQRLDVDALKLLINQLLLGREPELLRLLLLH